MAACLPACLQATLFITHASGSSSHQQGVNVHHACQGPAVWAGIQTTGARVRERDWGCHEMPQDCIKSPSSFAKPACLSHKPWSHPPPFLHLSFPICPQAPLPPATPATHSPQGLSSSSTIPPWLRPSWALYLREKPTPQCPKAPACSDL